jgi:succinate-semialdehyde dehydrogenase / glutarate-semialdehyde dehydrogenase
MKLKSINPYTNQVIDEIEHLTDTEIEKCIEKSDDAFDEWKKTTFEYRKKLMLNAAQQLKDSKDILAETISNEMGKPITEAKAEVLKCAWVCEHYANDADILLHKEAVATDAYMAYVTYEPLGTILGIMPWNFPFWQVFRFAAPTLMAGNVILLKHASNVQRCAKAIENLFQKAGFPVGVFQNLAISSRKVQMVIENGPVKAVTLTGSVAAGSNVAEIAGKNIKKTVLELGGNNAFVVLEDADIGKAVEIGIKARVANAGQNCIAAKRFILHEKISDAFLKAFKEKMATLKAGNPLNEDTEIGPLMSIDQANAVKKQVEASLKMGAKIELGGYPDKAFYPPTIVSNVKPGMPLFDEEVFGPVAAITVVKSIEEAVELANHSEFGLGVSLFTNDLEKALSLVPNFNEGAVFINDLVKSDPRLPFGGLKKSGYGRELSVNGIREFVNIKTVYIEKLHETAEKEEDRTVTSTGRTSW